MTAAHRGTTLIVAAVTIVGCGGGPGATQERSSIVEPTAAERPSRADGSGPAPRRPEIEPVRCPAAVSACRSAGGEIVYVERVDPDGDGDAHFVLFSDESITAPGISVIDVARDLRPHPLPGPGDLVSAAGPVYRGSYGQRQIEATKLRVVRD